MELEEQIYENTMLKRQIESMKNENMSYRKKTQIMRNKISNDYIVIKWLRDDLEHAIDYNGILSRENSKISTIIRDLNDNLNKFGGNTNATSDELQKELRKLDAIKQKFDQEKGHLNSRKQATDKKHEGKYRKDDYLSFKDSLGTELIETAEFDEFETQEISTQTDNHFRKNMGIQHAPQGYGTRGCQVDVPCTQCESYKTKEKRLEKENRLFGEKIQNQKTEIDDQNSRIESLLERLDNFRNKAKGMSSIAISKNETRDVIAQMRSPSPQIMNIEIDISKYELQLHGEDDDDDEDTLSSSNSSFQSNSQLSTSVININETNSHAYDALNIIKTQIQKTTKGTVERKNLEKRFKKMKRALRKSVKASGENSPDEGKSRRSIRGSRRGSRRGSKSFNSQSRNNNFSSSPRHTKIMGQQKVVINETKRRNNQLIKQANKIFNEVLEDVQVTINEPKAAKKAPMRGNTLVKQLAKIYNDYKQKRNSKSKRTKTTFSHYIYKYLSLKHSMKRTLTRVYKNVKKYFFLNFSYFYQFLII